MNIYYQALIELEQTFKDRYKSYKILKGYTHTAKAYKRAWLDVKNKLKKAGQLSKLSNFTATEITTIDNTIYSIDNNYNLYKTTIINGKAENEKIGVLYDSWVEKDKPQ